MTNEKRLSESRIAAIAEALDLTEEELLGEHAATMVLGAPLANFLADPQAQRLVDIWFRLTLECRSQLIAQLEAAAAETDQSAAVPRKIRQSGC